MYVQFANADNKDTSFHLIYIYINSASLPIIFRQHLFFLLCPL